MTRINTLLILVWLVLCQACSSSPERQSYSKPNSGQTNLVIWDFEGTDLTGHDNVDYLSRVLPEILLTDLANYPEIRLLERIKLIDALEELKIGSSEVTDEVYRLKVGKIVGANRMAFGHYFVSGKEIRIDLRVVDTETSLTLFSDRKKGELDHVEEPMSELAGSIAMKFGSGGTMSKKKNLSQITKREIWEEYEKGLELMDKRAFEMALAVFQNLLIRNPGFKPAEKQVGFAIERLERE